MSCPLRCYFWLPVRVDLARRDFHASVKIGWGFGSNQIGHKHSQHHLLGKKAAGVKGRTLYLDKWIFQFIKIVDWHPCAKKSPSTPPQLYVPWPILGKTHSGSRVYTISKYNLSVFFFFILLSPPQNFISLRNKKILLFSLSVLRQRRVRNGLPANRCLLQGLAACPPWCLD